jgi:hypothetical protein
MPSVKEALQADLSGYEPVTRASGLSGFPSPPEGQPTLNPFLRCPLPPIAVTPDSLRQYYSGGQIPQFRILTPADSSSGAGKSGGTTIINNSVSSTAGATSSGTGTTPTTGTPASSVYLTTASLAVGSSFVSSVQMSKSFQLLMVTADNPCRIEVYGTALAQTLDAGRGIDIATLPGTQQDVITDVVLDTLPYRWSWQNRVGANADNPQSTTIYITVTNESAGNTAITISLVFVPLES